MHSPQPHPSNWYCDPAWISAVSGNAGATPLQLMRTKVKGVSALITPSWSTYAAMPGNASLESIKSSLDESKEPLIVADFPPGVSCDWKAPWMLHDLHTRWLEANGSGVFPQIPKHRAKQIRKGVNAGIHISTCTDLERMVRLHQNSRTRKSIPSNEQGLRSLLNVIFETPYHSSFIATNQKGEDIANAIFIHHSDATVYAFGGQFRSPISAIASVMLIQKGIESAQSLGHRVFDFGGSSDAGVDQFYAEFGAVKKMKQRVVRVKGLWKIWLKLTRPDLFNT